MNAQPILVKVARSFKQAKLETVMIGNAAAAIQGAPVTTLDIDFIIRETTKNKEKLQLVANKLGGELISFQDGVTTLMQIQNPDEGIFLDFVTTADGIKSFASVRSRATEVDFDESGATIYVASLEDIITSKRAVGRPKDLAVIEELELTLDEQRKS